MLRKVGDKHELCLHIPTYFMHKLMLFLLNYNDFYISLFNFNGQIGVKKN